MADEDKLGKACDNPDVIKALGRRSPDVGGSFPGDPTEGMCTSVHCNFEDVDAWRIATDRFMDRLEDLNNLLKKKINEVYTSQGEDAPAQLIELLQKSESIIIDWEQSYDSYEPQNIIDGIREYGEYIIGYWFIHWKTKPIVEEIIAKFREAACIFDEVNDAYEALGGRPSTVPGSGQRPPSSDNTATKGIVAAALIGAAVFFGYQTTKSKKPKTAMRYG